MDVKTLVKQESFDEAITNMIETDMSVDDLVVGSIVVEDFFLKIKYARQWWHGVAYGKLKSDEDKKFYRDQFDIKHNLINKWAKTTKTCMSTMVKKAHISVSTQYPSLKFSHFEKVAPLMEKDGKKAIELLDDAEKKELTATQLGNLVATENQKIAIEDKATRIVDSRKKEGKKTSIADARKKAAADDEAERQRKAADKKLKDYNKAKEVIEKFEKTKAIDNKVSSKIVSATDAEDALKHLYRLAMKAAHEDVGGSNDEAVKVNAANDALKSFIKTWE